MRTSKEEEKETIQDPEAEGSGRTTILGRLMVFCAFVILILLGAGIGGTINEPIGTFIGLCLGIYVWIKYVYDVWGF